MAQNLNGRTLKEDYLEITEFRYERALMQLNCLGNKLQELGTRHEMAKSRNLIRWMKQLERRMDVLETIRNMYLEYATRQADDICQLRKDLYGEEVEVVMASEVADESDDEFEYI